MLTSILDGVTGRMRFPTNGASGGHALPSDSLTMRLKNGAKLRRGYDGQAVRPDIARFESGRTGWPPNFTLRATMSPRPTSTSPSEQTVVHYGLFEFLDFGRSRGSTTLQLVSLWRAVLPSSLCYAGTCPGSRGHGHIRKTGLLGQHSCYGLPQRKSFRNRKPTTKPFPERNLP